MIPSQRERFDIPEDVTYLNCAYMSPLMKTVIQSGTAGLERKARPWEIKVDDFFDHSERLRGLAAKLFGASADDVAIVPSASYGIATAALNLVTRVCGDRCPQRSRSAKRCSQAGFAAGAAEGSGTHKTHYARRARNSVRMASSFDTTSL